MFAVCCLLFYCLISPEFGFADTWTQKADIGGTQRLVAFGFSIADKGYAGGGIDHSNGMHFKDFWEYNPVTGIWTQKADLPINMSGGHVSFVINNKGYIGTGAFGGSSETKLFLEYDPTLNEWSRKADFGGTARTFASGFAVAGKGYIGTGWGDYGNNDPYNQNPILKDFWEYDPSTDTWTKKADFGGGIARDDAVGFSIGNKGYIGTGYSEDSEETLKKDFWEYDPTTDTWTRKADFAGTARGLAIGFSIGNKGYIGTGDDGIDEMGINETDFWEYDPATDIWTQRADFGGGARIMPVGFSIGNKGYLGMGMVYDPNGGPMTYKQDFWEYDPGFVVKNDFNKDGISDILWRKDSTGQVVLWFMNSDGTRSSYKTLLTDVNWTIAETGDFNKDGISDILWRKDSTGQVVLWFMNSDGTRSNYKTLLTDVNWTVVP